MAPDGSWPQTCLVCSSLPLSRPIQLRESVLKIVVGQDQLSLNQPPAGACEKGRSISSSRHTHQTPTHILVFNILIFPFLRRTGNLLQ